MMELTADHTLEQKENSDLENITIGGFDPQYLTQKEKPQQWKLPKTKQNVSRAKTR